MFEGFITSMTREEREREGNVISGMSRLRVAWQIIPGPGFCLSQEISQYSLLTFCGHQSEIFQSQSSVLASSSPSQKVFRIDE